MLCSFSRLISYLSVLQIEFEHPQEFAPVIMDLHHQIDEFSDV